MVDLPRSMPTYSQIDFAKGGLEVPLKIFTSVSWVQKQKDHLKRWCKAVELYQPHAPRQADCWAGPWLFTGQPLKAKPKLVVQILDAGSLAACKPLGYGWDVTGGKHSDATLVLLGHGSTKNEDSDKPVFQHAATLRSSGAFADVKEAFWKQSPQVKTVLTETVTPRVFIVPMFISEGYFCDQVIPDALGFPPAEPTADCRILRQRGKELFYTRPVGSHPSMLRVLLARAEEVVRKFPFPRAPGPTEISLFIAGHGTDRNENSRNAVERQVEQIRNLNRYASVHGIFLEEAPRIADCYALANTRNLVVVPFFISEGMHTQGDIPVMLGERENLVQQRLAEGRPPWRNPTERREKLVWYAPSIGSEPHLTDVILDLAKDCTSES